MSKRKPHHQPKNSGGIKPWHFLLVAAVSGVICVAALRANNQHMSELRAAVYIADKNNGDVQGSLKELQAYVTTHMNTSLTSGKNGVYPPIQLQYTYERLVAAQNAQFAQGSSLYSEAQRYCEDQNSTDFSGRNRVPCIQQYVLSHSTAKPAAVPEDLYKFSFASPKWSPDLAGFSLLVTTVSFLLFCVSALASRAIRRA